MKRFFSVLLIVIIISILLMGCTSQQKNIVTPNNSPVPFITVQKNNYEVTLFYPNNDFTAVVASSQSVAKKVGQSLYMNVMQALLGQDGTSRTGFSYAFDKDIDCRSIVQQENILYINFSWRFLAMPTDKIIAALVVLVNTYTQFSGVEFINISVEGKQLVIPDFPDRPIWLLNRFTNDPVELKDQLVQLKEQLATDKSSMHERSYAVVYYNLKDSRYLMPEVRAIDVFAGDYSGAVINELLSGPKDIENELSNIPSDFKLYEAISYSAASHTLKLSFVSDSQWVKPNGKWAALPSLINSLTHAVPDMENLEVSVYTPNANNTLDLAYKDSATVSEYGGYIRSTINMFVPNKDFQKLINVKAVMDSVPDENSYSLVFSQLISKLKIAIPKLTQSVDDSNNSSSDINYIFTNDNTVIIDISEKLYNEFSVLTKQEEFLTAYSIVATMCEVSNTNKAQILVDGQRRQYLASSINILEPLLNVPTKQLNSNSG